MDEIKPTILSLFTEMIEIEIKKQEEAQMKIFNQKD